MSKRDERQKDPWNDESEADASRGVNPRRPRAGGGRIYDEDGERPSRPARHSREEVYARLRRRPRQPIYTREQEQTRANPPAQGKPPAQLSSQEAQARLRQQPRQDRSTSHDEQMRPIPRRAQTGDYPDRQPAPRPQRATYRATPGGSVRPAQRADEQYEQEYEGYDEDGAYDEDGYAVMRRQRQSPVRQRRSASSPRKRRPARGRDALSTVLIGCVGGVLTLIVVAAVVLFLLLHNTQLGKSISAGIGKSTYTRTGQQALTLGSASQLILKNQVGNVSVQVDAHANSASVSFVKQVQASSASDANSQFDAMTLTSTPIASGADPACSASNCLLITTTLPPGSGDGLLGSGGSNKIDLILTLPTSFNALTTPSLISVTAPAGDIAVSGFNGILNLTGTASNISIAHTLLYAGTCIQTTHGTVNVDQGSFFNLNQPSNLVPCSNTTSTDPHPWFNLRSGVGDVHVTLSSNSTALLLDANTNNGKISDDFGLNISVNGNSASYHNPLLPNTNPTASLYLFTSTGNITINKQ